QLHEAESARGSIARGVLRPAKSKKGPRERPTLNTFREGNETLVRALGNKLASSILLRTRATNVYRQKDGAYHVSLEGSNNDSVSAKSVIFATPTDVTGGLLAQLASSFKRLLTSVEYAAVEIGRAHVCT